MVRTVTKIDRLPSPSKKQRVAAYCRVSTDRETQLTSLANQQEHYLEQILMRDDWELAGIYCDEGISGTKREIRPELMRLIHDCQAGRIDLILTKSISRFARNTADCLDMVRTLTDLGVEICFEKENLRTGSADGELFLSILASMAEDESRSISENGKWAVQKRYQNGTFRLSRPPYGYDLTDGVLRVNDAEAGVVRKIFDDVLAGMGTTAIAAQLNERLVPTKRKGRWHAGTIQWMVKNVFYAGDLLMQKTFHDSQFRVRINHGEFSQYYMENHHEAIVSRAVFRAANEALRQRGREKNTVPQENPQLREDPHQNRYCFTGKLHCGACGDLMKRQVVHRRDGAHALWACRTHLAGAGRCPQKAIPEDSIRHAFVTMLNKLAFARTILLVPYITEISRLDTLKRGDTLRSIQQKLEALTEEKQRLSSLYSNGSVEPSAYVHQMTELRARTKSLQLLRQSTECDSTCSAEARKLNRFLEHWLPGLSYFPEAAFADFVDHVRADSADQVTFVLRCGLSFAESTVPSESEI